MHFPCLWPLFDISCDFHIIYYCTEYWIWWFENTNMVNIDCNRIFFIDFSYTTNQSRTLSIRQNNFNVLSIRRFYRWRYSLFVFIAVSPFLGPFCFSVFIILVVFVCMSMFLSIINHSFRRVQKMLIMTRKSFHLCGRSFNVGQVCICFIWNSSLYFLWIIEKVEEYENVD